MKKTFKKTVAILSIIAIVFSLSAPAFAVETRGATNGYTFTSVTYNGKTYTISLGIGVNSSNGVRASAYCPIHGIFISIKGVSAKFDTEHLGYYPATGSSGSGTTNPSNGITNIYTPYVYCPNASDAGVKGVYTASTSATFYSVNNGSNVTISVNYKAN